MDSKRRGVAMVLVLIVTVSGLACTSTRNAETSGGKPDTKETCFNVSRVRSFSPLHESFVYVRVGSDEHYLLTLDSVYTSLPYATGITISGDFSWICSNTGAMITYRDSGRRVSCRILRIEAVDSKEAAVQLVEERTTPKPRG